MMRRFLTAVVMLAAAAPLPAQSLFGTRGLGVPVDPIDPRARALGSIGTGLLGLNTSLVNPAELAGILRRGVTATVQPFYGSEEIGGRTDDLAGTRFPIVQLLYPVRDRYVLALGYGGFMDQSWSVVSDRQEIVGNDTVDTRDQVSATGALAQVRLSASYEASRALGFGLAIGMYTGGLERNLTRTFPDSSLALLGFSDRSNWDYRGSFATLGVRLDATSTSRFTAAVTLSSDLDANGRTDDASDVSYDMPLRFAVGASTLLSSRLLATAAAQWTGWSESTNYAAPGAGSDARVVAQKTWEVGGGLEWEQLRTATRVFPLRVGFRYAQLPFRSDVLTGCPETDCSFSPAKEVAGSLGLGLRLAADEFGPLAVADIAVERGRRSGWTASFDPEGLTENFWRLSVSISLFGR
ncbi:MAG TPA: hypothetical protein VK864_18720 [Longimicrobiales bacterium]|nr:hypothetical protein [Longimicrobiales bacterium]